MTAGIGKITSWNDEKGFGFITPDVGGQSLFFHINDFSRTHKRPVQGLSVAFNITKDAKGRNCASHVSPRKGHKEVTKADKQRLFSIVLSGAFLLILVGLILLKKIPAIILGLYLVASVITFSLYAKDKSAAQTGEWRISEATLHLFSIVGGWPGAAIAQSQLRHKSKKSSFRVMYWLTVAINGGFLGWLLTDDGANELETLLKNINFI